jgi:hypothetical protein
VRDPGSTDPALRDWHGPAVPAAPGSKSTTTGSKTGCDLPEYINAAKPPTAIDCSAAKPGSTPTSGNTGAPSEYCDPAFACGKASTAPPTAPSNGGTNENTCNLMVKYVNPIIKGLAAVVGIGVTVSIVFAGIQYAMSADDSSKVSAAKSRITNSLLTLLGFFLFFAFLNWVIPGGINLKP